MILRRPRRCTAALIVAFILCDFCGAQFRADPDLWEAERLLSEVGGRRRHGPGPRWPHGPGPGPRWPHGPRPGPRWPHGPGPFLDGRGEDQRLNHGLDFGGVGPMNGPNWNSGGAEGWSAGGGRGDGFNRGGSGADWQSGNGGGGEWANGNNFGGGGRLQLGSGGDMSSSGVNSWNSLPGRPQQQQQQQQQQQPSLSQVDGTLSSGGQSSDTLGQLTKHGPPGTRR